MVISKNVPVIQNIAQSNKTFKFSSTDNEESFLVNKKILGEEWEYFNKEIEYNYNSWGYRTKEFDQLKEDYMIVFGCSFTEGIGLHYDDLWSTKLGKELNLDVLNLGMGATGIDFQFYNTILIHNHVVKKGKLPKLIVYQWPDKYRKTYAFNTNENGEDRINLELFSASYPKNVHPKSAMDYYDWYVKSYVDNKGEQIKDIALGITLCNNLWDSLKIPVVNWQWNTNVENQLDYIYENDLKILNIYDNTNVKARDRSHNGSVAQTMVVGEILMTLKTDNKVYCSLEDWDSVLDYYRPNGSSKSWYLNETGNFDYPKMWGVWNLFNIEDGNKPFGHDVIVENTTPKYGDDVVFQTKDEIRGKKHLYIINVYDNQFFKKNEEIGFKCISEQYINDIKNGKCKIVMIHQFEGYSASSSKNNDLDIVDSWISEMDLPHESVYYIHGNLLVDEVRKEKGFKFNCVPISIFDSWIDYRVFKDEMVEFKPVDNGFLFLSYNRNPRYHRVYLVSEFLRQGLLNKGRVSIGKFDSDETESIKLLSEMSPLIIDRTLDINWAGNLELPDHEATFMSIVTETLIDESVLFISEKIWKPIVVGHPFMILGNVGTLKYIKDLGFKTFDKWFDESYDNETIHHKRVDMVVSEINRYRDKSIDELKAIREEMRETCVYNRNRFLEIIKDKYDYDGMGGSNNKKPLVEIFKEIYKTF
jgi:hypothetical protein